MSGQFHITRAQDKSVLFTETCLPALDKSLSQPWHIIYSESVLNVLYLPSFNEAPRGLESACIFPPLVCPSQQSTQWFELQSSSVTQLCLTLRPHELQHARPPCPSPTPGVYSNSCPLSWWCHPTISSSVIPFSSCPQSLPASGSFQMSQLFAWGSQSTGVSASASVAPMNTPDWSPLGGDQ